MINPELNVLTQERSTTFALATLFYTRLRRVQGRVIDVTYLLENQQYAQKMLQLAIATQDADLVAYAQRLNVLLQLSEVPDAVAETSATFIEATVPNVVAEQISEEEIYRAQVSHHYIGALR